MNLIKARKAVRWNNWPQWLKGVFFMWPSIIPLYLIFISGRFLSYFDGVFAFIFFWIINLAIFGELYIVGDFITYLAKRKTIYSHGKKVVERKKKQSVNKKKKVLRKKSE